MSHDDTTLKCDFCSFTTKNYYELALHLDDEHDGDVDAAAADDDDDDDVPLINFVFGKKHYGSKNENAFLKQKKQKKKRPAIGIKSRKKKAVRELAVRNQAEKIICHVCRTFFKTQSGLKTHEKNSQVHYYCKMAEKRVVDTVIDTFKLHSKAARLPSPPRPKSIKPITHHNDNDYSPELPFATLTTKKSLIKSRPDCRQSRLLKYLTDYYVPGSNLCGQVDARTPQNSGKSIIEIENSVVNLINLPEDEQNNVVHVTYTEYAVQTVEIMETIETVNPSTRQLNSGVSVGNFDDTANIFDHLNDLTMERFVSIPSTDRDQTAIQDSLQCSNFNLMNYIMDSRQEGGVAARFPNMVANLDETFNALEHLAGNGRTEMLENQQINIQEEPNSFSDVNFASCNNQQPIGDGFLRVSNIFDNLDATFNMFSHLGDITLEKFESAQSTNQEKGPIIIQPSNLSLVNPYDSLLDFSRIFGPTETTESQSACRDSPLFPPANNNNNDTLNSLRPLDSTTSYPFNLFNNTLSLTANMNQDDREKEPCFMTPAQSIDPRMLQQQSDDNFAKLVDQCFQHFLH